MPLPKHAQQSYYDARNRQGASLLRARRPYIVRNIVTGVALCTFVISVYSYTIKVIAQDDFEDVPVPSEPVQRMAQTPVKVAPPKNLEAEPSSGGILSMKKWFS